MDTQSFLTPDKEGWLIVCERDYRYELRAHAENARPISIVWRGRVNFTNLFDFFCSLVRGQPVTVEAQTAGKMLTFERLGDRSDLARQFDDHGINPSDVVFLQCINGDGTTNDDQDTLTVAARVDLESLDTEENRMDAAPDDIELTLSVSKLEQSREQIGRFIHETNRYRVPLETTCGSLGIVTAEFA